LRFLDGRFWLAKAPVAKVNILYKSNDGGQTWQDISQGLPETEQPLNLSAGGSDLYLQVKNVMYRSKSDHKAPVWEKADFPDLQNAVLHAGVQRSAHCDRFKRHHAFDRQW
jgi:hypothetical protein